ncbi:MAG: hypothetical protein ACOCRK_03775 [bacterium]
MNLDKYYNNVEYPIFSKVTKADNKNFIEKVGGNTLISSDDLKKIKKYFIDEPKYPYSPNMVKMEDIAGLFHPEKEDTYIRIFSDNNGLAIALPLKTTSKKALNPWPYKYSKKQYKITGWKKSKELKYKYIKEKSKYLPKNTLKKWGTPYEIQN